MMMTKGEVMNVLKCSFVTIRNFRNDKGEANENDAVGI